MKAVSYKETIENVFKNIILECQCGVHKEKLSENGAIYYENGYGGTEFDWQMNERLCEFMNYWRSF